MKVGRVAGTVVATIKAPLFESHPLLVCDLLDESGAAHDYTIAVDVVGAGRGETVLVLDEGTSARQILGTETGPVRAVVVGIVDELFVDGELRDVR